MIYVGTTTDNGSAIYFDIHAAERLGRGVRISGTIGDGSYEGEVLVEIGRTDSVTFADAWLGGFGYSEFANRCNLDLLEDALLDAVSEMPVFHTQRSQPHGINRLNQGSSVSEDSPVWNLHS